MVWSHDMDSYGKEKVASRVPIYVFNDSEDTIRVMLTSEDAVSDSMSSVKTTFGVGQMCQTIPALMDGELAPPVPEESCRFFRLHVQTEDASGVLVSSWNEVQQIRVQRGDVLVYKKKADLLKGRRGVLELVPDPRRRRKKGAAAGWRRWRQTGQITGGSCIMEIISWFWRSVGETLS